MTQIHAFLGAGLIAIAVAVTPAVAQQQGRTSQQDRERDTVSSNGQMVAQDVPAAGTQTDQRGRTAAKGGDDTSGALKGPDRDFLAEAMEGHRAEVALARLAQQKADSQAVRDLATVIEADHQEAGEKLQSIAASVGAADNATELKPKHKQLQERLSRLDAVAFDKAYVSEMVKDHQKDIQAYEKASRQVQHVELKAYATEWLPTLKQHLDHARTLQQGGGQSKTQ